MPRICFPPAFEGNGKAREGWVMKLKTTCTELHNSATNKSLINPTDESVKVDDQQSLRGDTEFIRKVWANFSPLESWQQSSLRKTYTYVLTLLFWLHWSWKWCQFITTASLDVRASAERAGAFRPAVLYITNPLKIHIQVTRRINLRSKSIFRTTCDFDGERWW